MEIRHLHYFIAVAEELHFSRAAAKLHIAQPPLSQQVQDLEAELGVKLFHRTKRRVELTSAGQVFLQEIRAALQQIQQAIASAQRANRGDIGRLVIGFNSSATYGVLPKVLQTLKETYPDIELVLQELTTSQQLDYLYENKIDVGLLYLPIEDCNLCYLSLLKERLVVAIRNSHLLATQSQISIRALAREPFILPPPHLGAGLYSQIVHFFGQNGFTPHIGQEATLLQTAIALVAGGVGVALVPASMQNLQIAGVTYKPLQELTPEIEIGLAWRRNDSSAVLQKFLSVFSDAE